MAYRAVCALLAAALVSCGGEGVLRQGIGGACASSGDCQAGLFCETADPGGQCVKSCNVDGDCGAGAVCNDEKKCYKACLCDGDCTRGAPYFCVGTSPRKFCDVADSDGGAD